MKELEVIHGRWRKKLFRTNLLLTIMLFFVEIIMFFVLKKLALIEQPILLYLKWFLVEPLLFNVAVLLLGYLVVKYIPANSVYINYIPIIQMAIICMITACVHNIFSMTLCLLCFPIFATVMFSDKRMTRSIGLICYVFLIISLVYRRICVFRPLNDKYFWADIFVSLAILTATLLFCNVLIAFSKEKTDMIQKGYLEQIHMKEQLNRDQKTGLYGHTIFMNTLEQKVETAKQSGNSFAVAVIDIDDFKHVNDTYGHLKGDQVIISLANKMKKMFQEDQLIARYGGEEFAIIFSEKDLGQVSTRLENLRCAFEKQRYDFMEDKITISIGIATWRQGLTSEQIFEAADNAMYASKMEGKNRTTTHGCN